MPAFVFTESRHDGRADEDEERKPPMESAWAKMYTCKAKLHTFHAHDAEKDKKRRNEKRKKRKARKAAERERGATVSNDGTTISRRRRLPQRQRTTQQLSSIVANRIQISYRCEDPAARVLI
jgi:hypothetical protein